MDQCTKKEVRSHLENKVGLENLGLLPQPHNLAEEEEEEPLNPYILKYQADGERRDKI